MAAPVRWDFSVEKPVYPGIAKTEAKIGFERISAKILLILFNQI